MLVVGLLPATPSNQWPKWVGLMISVTTVPSSFLIWTLIPSNVTNPTRKTVTSSMTFIALCGKL